MPDFNIVMPKLGESVQEATIIRWLVKPGDVGGLAGVLEKALHNPEMLNTLSQAARIRYADLPTWAETADTIRQFLIDQI